MPITTKKLKPTYFADHAPSLATGGFHPIPLNGKRPHESGWLRKAALSTRGRWCKTYPGSNIGILTGEVAPVDIDNDTLRYADAAQAITEALLGPTDFIRIGRYPRRALFYRIDTPMEKLATAAYPNGRVEILGGGQQIVTHGEHPSTGRPYTWPKRDIASAKINDLPLVTVAQLDHLKRVLDLFLSPPSSLPPSVAIPGMPSFSGPFPNPQPRSLPQAANQNTPGAAGLPVRSPHLVPVGKRNSWLIRRACEHAWSCTTEAELKKRLQAENLGFSTPLPDHEVESITRSAWNYKRHGRLFQKGRQVTLLPIGKEIAVALSKTHHALGLYALLRATRPSDIPFGIALKATAELMGCGKKASAKAIDVLIREGLLVEMARLPRSWPHQGARQYKFTR